jgi:hypothetical protein
MSVSVNGTNGLTFNDATTQNTSAFYGGLAMRNRIINGAMVIDQRNAGASVTPATGAFLVDRWQYAATQASKFTAQQTPSATETGFATRVSAGFTNYQALTVASAVSVGAGDTFYLKQTIEGFNVADLAWGTANAKTVTLSFLAYSSLTGTFGGSLFNSSGARSYPFSYSIPTANTWTQISVTIAGDTSGTWLTTNGIGIAVNFGLGSGSTFTTTANAWAAGTYVQPNSTVSVVGTSGATFYITGVQFEKGSTATSFDYRPYGTELLLCQRYYQEACSVVATTSAYINHLRLPVSMRIGPSIGTITFDAGTGASFGLVGNTGGGTAGLSLYQASNHSVIATAQKIPLSAEL